MTEGALHIVGGAIINSSAHHVVALAQTFGVHPSYLFERGRKQLTLSTRRRWRSSGKKTLSATAHNRLHLPLKDGKLLLNKIRQFEETQEIGEGDDAMPKAPG